MLMKNLRTILYQLLGSSSSKAKADHGQTRPHDCTTHLTADRARLAQARAQGLPPPNPLCLFSINYKLKNIEPRLLKTSSTSQPCSIFRVPASLLLHSSAASFSPSVISIGPLHLNLRSLLPIQEHKPRCLNTLLHKLNSPPSTLPLFVSAIAALESKARNCYSENFPDIDSKDFVEMLVLDGCFIIYLFCQSQLWDSEDDQDPILRTEWLLANIVTDLLLLENQIPFFVLQTLFDLADIKDPQCLTHLALNFFRDRLPYLTESQTFNSAHESEPLHLLHLFHISLPPRLNSPPNSGKAKKKRRKDRDLEKSQLFIPCTAELQEAGIKFSKNNKGGSFMEISFRRGVIHIPALTVDDSTQGIFLNLIMFEQFYRYCRKYVTCYAKFMDDLVNTARDVGLLCRRGIVRNYLGSEEDVAEIFNKMGKEVLFDQDDFYLKDVYEEVNDYCESALHVWRANLMRNYFNNPWAVISVIAAAFLLLLTVAQTFFAIVSYTRGQ